MKEQMEQIMKSTRLTNVAATTLFAALAKPLLLARALRALVLLVGVVVTGGLARATFPGENGLIVFDTWDGARRRSTPSGRTGATCASSRA